ncbi:TetR/AcrR family transcriptional regulator [Bradyrhizobium cenepequi]
MSASRKAARSIAGESTKDRILRVAVDEFAKRGFAAARIDEIARRARANKQLIYYYFKGKAGLYEAVLEEMIERAKPIWASVAHGDLKQLITMQMTKTADHEGARWRRLLAWEGIEYGARSGRRIHLESVRSAAYRTQTDVLEREKNRGALPAEIDPKVLSLMLTLLSLGPDLLPQVTKLITGKDARDPTLRHDVQNALLELLGAASRRETPATSHEPQAK